MNNKSKELRNKIIGLRKLLQSSPKSDQSQIKQEIKKLEEELETVRKIPKSQPDSEEVQPPLRTQEFKPSKSLLKKQKKQTEVELQRQEALKSLQTSHSKIISEEEESDLAKQLKDLDLQVFDIPSDGNCLFAAIQHQLALIYQNSSFSDLRKIAVQAIQNSPDEFSSFLVDENLDDYCLRMSRPGEWGGEMELVALSKALGKTIKVFQAFTPPLVINHTNQDLNATNILNLSYHRHAYALGEHYNSLIPRSQK
jgi:OTU domain-containing protein 6